MWEPGVPPLGDIYRERPSPRLLWTLFCTWVHRWRNVVGIPPVLLDLIGVYMYAYLFVEVPYEFLVGLQRLIGTWLPLTAIGPCWLWKIVFDENIR